MGKSFDPKVDAGFCAWLRDDKHLTVEKIRELDHPVSIEQLRREYAQQLKEEVEIIDKYSRELSESGLRQIGVSPLGIEENVFKRQETVLRESSKNTAQEWLNRHYPKSQRSNYVELVIIGKGLKGELSLEGFTNLEVLECNKNKLTKLDVSMCSKLKVLDCSYNRLVDLDISSNRSLITIIC